MHKDGVMRNSYVARVVAVGMALIGMAAIAAGSGLNLNTQIATQKIALNIASNTSALVVKANGPVLNTNIHLGSQSSDCSTLVGRIAPGVCVPDGPGDPVSPN